jgi:hypothetical protein
MADITLTHGSNVTLLSAANANGAGTTVAVLAGSAIGKLHAWGSWDGATVSVQTTPPAGDVYVEADDTRMTSNAQIAAHFTSGASMCGG